MPCSAIVTGTDTVPGAVHAAFSIAWAREVDMGHISTHMTTFKRVLTVSQMVALPILT